MSVKLRHWTWNKNREAVAVLLAEGYTHLEVVAKVPGVTHPAMQRWLCNPEMRAEIDRLTFMVGVAKRAERLRLAMRLARQRVEAEATDAHPAGFVHSEKDLLDWLKYIQSETDGIKVELATLFESLEKSLQLGEETDGTETVESTLEEYLSSQTPTDSFTVGEEDQDPMST